MSQSSTLQILKITKDSLKGKVGIQNLGNTCYMSSAIQCLSNIYEFSSYFLNNAFNNMNMSEKNKKSILIQFSNIINKLHYGTERIIMISSLRTALGVKYKMFLQNTQEDSQEFLLTVLDELHQDLNSFTSNSLPSNEESTKNESNHFISMAKCENGEKELLSYLCNNQSIVSDFFVGQFRSSVQCFKCKNVSHSFDIFMSLSLPIPVQNDTTLQIYFVFFDVNKGILNIEITIENDLLVIDLRNQISGILNIHPMSFFICTMDNNEIEQIYNCLSPITAFTNMTSITKETKIIFCYQFDPNLNSIDNKFYTKSEKNDTSFNNSTDNYTAGFGCQYKKIHIGDLSTEPQETFYTQVDSTFIELYPCKDFARKGSDFYQVMQNIDNAINNSMSSEKSIKEEAKKILISTLSNTLLVYSDENYGYSSNYLKVFITFTKYNSPFIANPTSGKFSELSSVSFNSNTKRTEFSFQRALFVNTKWSLIYLTKYIENLFTIDSHRPDIRIVNINKNKPGKACLVCKDENCDNCLLSNVRGLVTVEDIINLYPKNKNHSIDNSYLYYDLQQRKITITRSDFELELCYPHISNEAVSNVLHLTKKIVTRKNTENKTVKKDTLDIYDCLKKFSQKEILDEGNVWFCEKCKMNQKAIKKIQLNYSPMILIIQLKRFKNGGNVKIDNYIDIPINNFMLKNYNVKEEYELVAIINHYGSIGFGHYTAICKNYYNKKWYKYDDAAVSEIDEKNIISNCAYVLFYKKKSFNVDIAKTYFNEKLRNIEEVKKTFKSFQINYIKQKGKKDSNLDDSNKENNNNPNSKIE